MTCAGGTVLAKQQPLLPPQNFKLKGTSTICPRIRYLLVTSEAALSYLPLCIRNFIADNILHCHYLELKHVEKMYKSHAETK